MKTGCHPEPYGSAQGRLREGPGWTGGSAQWRLLRASRPHRSLALPSPSGAEGIGMTVSSLKGGSMQSFRNRVLGCVLAAALAVAPAALASDPEAGSRLWPDRPVLSRNINY